MDDDAATRRLVADGAQDGTSAPATHQLEARYIMTSIARVAILTLALTWTALWCQPSFAQPPSDQSSKIQFSYIPPKSLKYLPVFNRVQQFKLLEQLSEFLSPLRLPHKFSMVTIGRWKDGKMFEVQLFWDNREFIRQLGLSK